MQQLVLLDGAGVQRAQMALLVVDAELRQLQQRPLVRLLHLHPKPTPKPKKTTIRKPVHRPQSAGRLVFTASTARWRAPTQQHKKVQEIKTKHFDLFAMDC